MVKFIHTSDWQLGMKRAYLDEGAQARFDDERFGAVRQILELAENQDCDFVAVAGDVFETNQPEQGTLIRALDALKSSNVPVYLLPGNHDSLEPGSVYSSSSFKNSVPDNVRVLRTQDPIKLSEGVEIVGAPMMARRVTTDLVKGTGENLEVDPKVTRIMLAHGQIQELMGIVEDPSLISLVSAEGLISSGKLDFIALGDSHSAASVGKTNRIWYSGSPVATRRTEPNPNKVLIVELVEDTVVVEELPIGNWTFISVSNRLDGSDDVDEFKSWVEQIPNKEKTVLRLEFEGALDLQQHDRVQRICTESEVLFAALRIPDGFDRLVVSPSTSDYDELHLSGFAKDAFEDLVAKTESNNSEAETAKDALILLYRLAVGSELG